MTTSKRPIIKCKICKKEFLGYIYRKSKFCSKQCCGKAKLGKTTWMKGKKGLFKGEKSPTWKGDDAKPDAIHKWVISIKGKATKCEHCKIKNLIGKDGRNLMHWTNVDHKYRRNLNDFIQLCISCHRKYDKSYFNLHPHLKN